MKEVSTRLPGLWQYWGCFLFFFFNYWTTWLRSRRLEGQKEGFVCVRTPSKCSGPETLRWVWLCLGLQPWALGALLMLGLQEGKQRRVQSWADHLPDLVEVTPPLWFSPPQLGKGAGQDDPFWRSLPFDTDTQESFSAKRWGWEMWRVAGVGCGQVRRHCSLAPPSGHEESKSMAPRQAHLSSVEIRLMWHCCLYHFLLWRPFNHLKLRLAEVQNRR